MVRLFRLPEVLNVSPPFANEAAQEEPVEISPGVWWVGVRLALYTAKRSDRDRVCAAETLVRSSD